MIILSVIYIILSFIVVPTIAPTTIGDLIEGVMLGLTDLPYLIAVLTSILEGCLVGAVFGAFIGSLKYKPAGTKAKKVKSKGEEENSGW